MVLYYTNAKSEARFFTLLISPLFWFNFTFTLSIEILNHHSAYKSLSWRSTVLKAFNIEVCTLVIGQDSITWIKEYLIAYWKCVLLDYFVYAELPENLGKRYIQRFPSGHISPPTVKEKFCLLHKKKPNPKSNKIRYHSSKNTEHGLPPGLFITGIPRSDQYLARSLTFHSLTKPLENCKDTWDQ